MAAALVHYLYGGIRLSVPRDRLSGAAQVHLSALLGVFVLAKAADYWLDRFDLVTGSGSLFTGMGYTDDHAVLPAKEILTGIALICAVLFFLNIWRRTWLLPSMGIALLALSAVLLGLIVPGIVQQFQVSPNVPDKEGKYIAANIEATRAAYDLDEIEVSPYVREPDTNDGDLEALDAITSSVPLLDPKVVSPTFETQQQVRAYYSVQRRPRRRPLQDRRQGARARARRARARPVRSGLGRAQLVQPAHGLHPRQRHHCGVRQPATGGRRAPVPQHPVGRGPGEQRVRADQPQRGRLRVARLLRRAQPVLLHRRQAGGRQRRRARPAEGRARRREPDHDLRR